MADVSAVLAANRAAVNEFLAVADQAAASWNAAPAPGRWSPSQIAEHVALTLEEAANVVAGVPSKFPTFPGFIRPLVRGLFFNRVLKKNGFPRLKTMKALNPDAGPPTPEDARPRIEDALDRFDQECRARVTSGEAVTHPVFGRISVENYAKFLELHARHHHAQLAGTLRHRVGASTAWRAARGL